MGDFQPSLEQKKIILNSLTHQESFRISQEIADSIPAILLTEICEATAEEREFAILQITNEIYRDTTVVQPTVTSFFRCPWITNFDQGITIDIQNTVIQRYIQVKGYKELGTKIIGGV